MLLSLETLDDVRFFEELRAVDTADLEALLATDIRDLLRALFSFIGDHRPSENFCGSYQPGIGWVWVSHARKVK
jgi:hypothetical protein